MVNRYIQSKNKDMEQLKTILRGISYTILLWVVYAFLLAVVLALTPIILPFLAISAFMYAFNPESIVKDITNKKIKTIDYDD